MLNGNKNRYVLPTPFYLRGQLLEYNRLYAFPAMPEAPDKEGFVILDSGAFALSLEGKSIDAEHMKKLNEYYKIHQSKNVFCVAPDVFLNPMQSIENWDHWHNERYCKVCPVLQSSKKFELKDLEWQIDYYADFDCDFWFFSNPSMRGKQAQSQYRKIKKLTDKARKAGAKWIHNLGAGWNLEDIQDWWHLGCFDSMDSIAYYTSVTNQENWTKENNAIINAYEANKITVI